MRCVYKLWAMVFNQRTIGSLWESMSPQSVGTEVEKVSKRSILPVLLN